MATIEIKIKKNSQHLTTKYLFNSKKKNNKIRTNEIKEWSKKKKGINDNETLKVAAAAAAAAAATAIALTIGL